MGTDDHPDDGPDSTDHGDAPDSTGSGDRHSPTDSDDASDSTDSGDRSSRIDTDDGPGPTDADDARTGDTDDARTGDTDDGLDRAGSRIGVTGRLVLRAPTLVLARRNLSRARTRTLLAVAAVVIGIVAVGGIGLAGDAFTRSQTEAFEGFGGSVTVDPVFSSRTPPSEIGVTDRELAQIAQATTNTKTIPLQRGQINVEINGNSKVTPYSALPNPSQFYADEAASGTVPTEWTGSRAVVIGSTVAEDLNASVGDRVRLSGDGFDGTYRVVAVLEPQGFFDPLFVDRSVLVPPDRDSPYDSVIVQANDPQREAETLVTRLDATLNEPTREYEITSQDQFTSSVTNVLRIGSSFATAVGGVSLLVAVVTIANTMLMSVIEREGEIGVLRAVGYTKFAIVRLLLAESVLIGTIGAAIAVPITLGLGVLANDALLGDPFAFTATGIAYIVVGVVAGLVASVVAGLYPAVKAARKRPVEALE